jgi:hypothetical protein
MRFRFVDWSFRVLSPSRFETFFEANCVSVRYGGFARVWLGQKASHDTWVDILDTDWMEWTLKIILGADMLTPRDSRTSALWAKGCLSQKR